jgi:hypothetical protein
LSLLDLIPAPYRLAIEFALVLAIAGVLFGLGHKGGVQAEHARMQVKLDAIQHQWDIERQNLQARAIQAEQERDAKSAQRIASAQEQDHEDVSHAEHRADAAVATASAADRLRQRAEAALASCGAARSPDPAASAVSPPAAQASSVLPDVLRRVAEVAGQLATFADASDDAAQSCAARYDSLSKK